MRSIGSVCLAFSKGLVPPFPVCGHDGGLEVLVRARAMDVLATELGATLVRGATQSLVVCSSGSVQAHYVEPGVGIYRTKGLGLCGKGSELKSVGLLVDRIIGEVVVVVVVASAG